MVLCLGYWREIRVPSQQKSSISERNSNLPQYSKSAVVIGVDAHAMHMHNKAKMSKLYRVLQ